MMNQDEESLFSINFFVPVMKYTISLFHSNSNSELDASSEELLVSPLDEV